MRLEISARTNHSNELVRKSDGIADISNHEGKVCFVEI